MNNVIQFLKWPCKFIVQYKLNENKFIVNKWNSFMIIWNLEIIKGRHSTYRTNVFWRCTNGFFLERLLFFLVATYQTTLHIESSVSIKRTIHLVVSSPSRRRRTESRFLDSSSSSFWGARTSCNDVFQFVRRYTTKKKLMSEESSCLPSSAFTTQEKEKSNDDPILHQSVKPNHQH